MIFSKKDVDDGNAFGLQKRPFVQDIDFVDHNFVSVLTKDKIFQWQHTNIIKKESVNAPERLQGEETLSKALPAVVKLPNGSLPFLLALSQQSIHVVNKITGMQYDLVKQRANCQNDCLEDLFLTYEREKDGSFKIKKLTLHYFERFYDYRKKLKNSTYNMFDLTDDFLTMLQTCGEILPSEKTKLVKTIESYKHPNDFEHMDKDQRKKWREARKKEAKKTKKELEKENEKELALSEVGFNLNQNEFENWVNSVQQQQEKVDAKMKQKIEKKLNELNDFMKSIGAPGI